MDKLLLDQVKQDLRTLRLKDMVKALDSALKKASHNRSGHLEFLHEILAVQLAARHKRSVERRIKKAVFPKNMSFETFDWGFQPGLNVEQLKDLKELGFVRKKHPLLILARPGAGKTHIATAIGLKACEAGFKVQFYRLQEILNQLYASLADDSTDELLLEFSKLDLLILDHVSYIRSKEEHPSLLLDLVSTCQDRVSLIVTTNISLEEWGTALGNPSVINAVVDRLFHHAEILNIREARSYRTEGPHAPKPPSDLT